MSDLSNYLESLGYTWIDRKILVNKVAPFKEASIAHIMKGPAIIQVKRDGVRCEIVMADGNAPRFFSRTGKEYTNIPKHIVEFVEEVAPRDIVFEAELYVQNKSIMSLEELSGAVNPNRVKPLDDDTLKQLNHALLYIFDKISVYDFAAGYSDVPYSVRMPGMDGVIVTNRQEYDAEHQRIVGAGEEGSVLKGRQSVWKARVNTDVVKQVRGVEYDLKVVEVIEGKGKRAGTVGHFALQWADEQTIKADLACTDEQRQVYWDNKEDTLGKVFRVTALGISSKGVLRLPKVRDERFDKTEGDY